MFKKNQRRLVTVDFLRGFSILLMIVFHFSFDLNHFHFIDIDIYHGDFWHYFRWFILTLFIFISGYTLSLVHAKRVVWKKAFKRSRELLVLSLIITVATYFLFPTTWVYFGVLHFFTIAMLLVLPLVYYPKTALLLAFVLAWGYYESYISVNIFYQWFQPLLDLPQRTEDLVPILPWIVPMLVGLFAGYYKLLPEVKSLRRYKLLLFMGRHPLFIYMVHQPILFALLMFVKSLGA